MEQTPAEYVVGVCIKLVPELSSFGDQLPEL